MSDTQILSDEQIEALRGSVEKLSALLEITRLLTAEMSLDDLLELIVAKTSELMDADRSTVYIVDRVRCELWSKVAQEAEIAEIRLPLKGQGLASHVARSGETINISDAYQDPRFNPEIDRRTGWRTQNMLIMPIRNRRHEITGVFQVMNKLQGPFTPEDEELLASLAASAAIAIENAKLYAEQKQSINELKQAVEALRIEIDDVKKARQVEAITETDYFRSLRKRAGQLRRERQVEECQE